MNTVLSIIIFFLNAILPFTLAHCDIWNRYTGMNQINDLAVHGDEIWCATEGGVICWNRSRGISEKYTGDDIFARLTFNAVEVDKDGIIWFGKQLSYFPHPGVVCYNGSEWIEFDETSGFSIKEIAVDKNNVKWFLTNQDVVLSYDGVSWKTYTADDGFPVDCLQGITFDNKGYFWFITGGLTYYNGDTQTTYTTENSGLVSQVISFAVDSTNALWMCFAIPDCGIMRYDGSTWTQLLEKDGLPFHEVTALTVDSNGIMWFGGNKGGVMSYNGTSWKLHAPNNGQESDSITALAVGKDGNPWFVTLSGGLTGFDGSSWITLYDEYGPSNNGINDIAVDRDNIKWFAAYDGVASFDDTAWHHYTESAISLCNVCTVAIDKNNIKWFGTGKNGVMSFDGTTWTNYTVEDGLSHNRIRSIAVDRDNTVWVCTSNGICCYDGVEWKTYTTDDGLISDYADEVIVDHDNVKWFRIHLGTIMSFDGNEWKAHDVDDGSIATRVGGIAVDSNNIKWFAISPIMSYDGTKWVTHRYEFMTCSPRSVATEKDGVIWFGFHVCSMGGATMGGLMRYDGSTWEYRNELSWKTVTTIAVDHNNVKWIGSYMGVWSLEDNSIDVSKNQLVPDKIMLHGIYPNPFNSRTIINFSVPENDLVNIIIYNMAGQKVQQFQVNNFTTGRQSVYWDGCNEKGLQVSSGVYLVHISQGNQSVIGRMVYMK